jgi:hypothetical protein
MLGVAKEVIAQNCKTLLGTNLLNAGKKILALLKMTSQLASTIYG